MTESTSVPSAIGRPVVAPRRLRRWKAVENRVAQEHILNLGYGVQPACSSKSRRLCSHPSDDCSLRLEEKWDVSVRVLPVVVMVPRPRRRPRRTRLRALGPQSSSLAYVNSKRLAAFLRGQRQSTLVRSETPISAFTMGGSRSSTSREDPAPGVPVLVATCSDLVRPQIASLSASGFGSESERSRESHRLSSQRQRPSPCELLEPQVRSVASGGGTSRIGRT